MSDIEMTARLKTNVPLIVLQEMLVKSKIALSQSKSTSYFSSEPSKLIKLPPTLSLLKKFFLFSGSTNTESPYIRRRRTRPKSIPGGLFHLPFP